jgi:hypothetical protein
MNGKFYANCFVHFEIIAPVDGPSTYDPALDIPPYIIPNSHWHKDWQMNHPDGWKSVSLYNESLICLYGKAFPTK